VIRRSRRQSPQTTQKSAGHTISVRRTSAALTALFAAAVVSAACGKKGPPLPPLVKLPVAPPEIVAERRGDTVDLRFTVPSTNTDGTRPANVASTDVYAITAPAAAPRQYTDAQLMKYGTKVASVPVKAPKDPNLTANPDEPADEVDPPEGNGLDQGAAARVSETLSAAQMEPVQVPADSNAARRGTLSRNQAESMPLLGPLSAAVSRTYAAVGISTRGKHGPLSRRVVVPLVPPPPAPDEPSIAYDEHAVTITWPPLGGSAGAADAADVLPSRVIGIARPDITYNVYDVSDPEAPAKLTTSPVADTKYEDRRMAWGDTRCYALRAAERVADATIESDLSPAACETLEDTFPPAAPKGLAAIASEGAINLIWDPNGESDLAGYLLLRARLPSDKFESITPQPIQDTSFRDAVQPGITFAYVVRAVDKAGNESAPSPRVAESAR
jgi:hypothetical protein